MLAEVIDQIVEQAAGVTRAIVTAIADEDAGTLFGGWLWR
jgi:hypothetical protein